MLATLLVAAAVLLKLGTLAPVPGMVHRVLCGWLARAGHGANAEAVRA
jgi:hypothetical protein